MACVSFGPNQPLIYVTIATAIVVLVYIAADDFMDIFHLITLQNEEATCGEFLQASDNAQVEFLKSCNCLDDTGDGGSHVAVTTPPSPAALESCVREAVKACAAEDSLHRITRACLSAQQTDSDQS
jgi:hypothetical protein